jgi:hypothetical protein
MVLQPLLGAVALGEVRLRERGLQGAHAPDDLPAHAGVRPPERHLAQGLVLEPGDAALPGVEEEEIGDVEAEVVLAVRRRAAFLLLERDDVAAGVRALVVDEQPVDVVAPVGDRKILDLAERRLDRLDRKPELGGRPRVGPEQISGELAEEVGLQRALLVEVSVQQDAPLLEDDLAIALAGGRPASPSAGVNSSSRRRRRAAR